MPLSVVPTSENDPAERNSPASTPLSEHAPNSETAAAPPVASAPPPAPRSTSRWVDYDTHELLEMISQLEDERRWARLREGVLWAILLHALLLLGMFLLPRYIVVPRVVQPQIAAKDRNWTYLDTPRLPATPKPQKPLVAPKPPVIDRKTLEALNKPPAPPAPVEQPKLEQPKIEQPKAQAPPPIPPTKQSQSPIEAPQPKAVPARPNFAMGSQNPADQLKEAMRGASRPGSGSEIPPGALTRHPGAGGGATILSDTQGVDFSSWLQRWYYETEHSWDPLIPDEVNPPILKQGQVQIRFKVLPDGQVTDMHLEGRSGDTGLDRAAWGAITSSHYPPLPHDFHGPYLELRAVFMYNMNPR